MQCSVLAAPGPQKLRYALPTVFQRLNSPGVPSPDFLSEPSGLDPEQHAAWTRRQYVAECAVTFLSTKTNPLDRAVLDHLQDYVAGDATLGQAIGRIVDHVARASQELGGLQAS